MRDIFTQNTHAYILVRLKNSLYGNVTVVVKHIELMAMYSVTNITFLILLF